MTPDKDFTDSLEQKEAQLKAAWERIGQLEKQLHEAKTELSASREDQAGHYIDVEELKSFREKLLQYRVDLNATRRYMRQEYERAEMYERAFSKIYSQLNFAARVYTRICNLLFWKNWKEI